MSYETEQAKLAAIEYSKCRYHDDSVSIKKNNNNKNFGAYHAEIGTYDSADMVICEQCGNTFHTNDENEDYCHKCRKDG